MKVGIVGCGLIGEKRVASAEGHEILVANDLNSDRARALTAKYGGSVTAHWRDVVAADVDAVIVATTHGVLAEVALAAVEAGITCWWKNRPGAIRRSLSGGAGSAGQGPHRQGGV